MLLIRLLEYFKNIT